MNYLSLGGHSTIVLLVQKSDGLIQFGVEAFNPGRREAETTDPLD